MAPLPPPPPGIDLHASKRPTMVGVFAGTWAIAVIATILRLWSRRLTKSKLWWDDWLIIIAVVWAGVFMFDVTVWMADNGFGRHIWILAPDATKIWAQGLFLAEYTYTLSLVFIKWSILAWYYRLFRVESSIKPFIWVLFAMVCCWGIAVILVTSLQCFPIQAFWQAYDPVNPMKPGEFFCGVDVHKFFLGNAIPNIITDILIIIVPLPYILRLHLRVSQKVALVGIFVVGIFVTIVSAVRLVFVVNLNLNSPDVTWDQADEMMWTGVEVNIGALCANLLTLRPILNLMLHGSVYVDSQARSQGNSGQINYIGPDSTSKNSIHLLHRKRTRDDNTESGSRSRVSTPRAPSSVQHADYVRSDSPQGQDAFSMGFPVDGDGRGGGKSAE